MVKLYRHRLVPIPTLWGSLCLLVAFLLPVTLWVLLGERFLAVTDRADADVLIVEAWTHEAGARAAAAEFRRPGTAYRYLVAAGGLTGESWYRERWSEPDIVRRELLRQGLPPDAVVVAAAPDVRSQRTFASAQAARSALAARGITPRAINVFTLGSHARRSRLIFSKTFGSGLQVGVISWRPHGYVTRRWWQSSERSVDFLKESVGFVYELVLNSGRDFAAPPVEPRAAITNGESITRRVSR